MDFMTSLIASTPEITHFLGKFLNVLFGVTKNFGWAVVLFTVIIKLALSPIDFWQKFATRKQSKAMARLQPEMAKLQKQYASRPDILRQKQAELYKKQNVSMLASCLPTVLNLVVFFIVFAGFNSMVRFQNEMIIYNLYEVYTANVGLMSTEELNSLLAASYQPDSWLWVQNIFMPDNWSKVIPEYEKFVGNGIGGMNAIMPENIAIPDAYNKLVGPAIAAQGKRWNGFLILPILSIVVSILSAKFMQASTPPGTGTEKQQKQQQSTMKVMMFAMPIMIGVFSLFYSAAFSLYLFVSNLFTTILNLVYNIITKNIDKKEKDRELSTTFVRRK